MTPIIEDCICGLEQDIHTSLIWAWMNGLKGDKWDTLKYLTQWIQWGNEYSELLDLWFQSWWTVWQILVKRSNDDYDTERQNDKSFISSILFW